MDNWAVTTSNQYSLSTASVLGPRSLYATVAWGVHEHLTIAEETEWDGIQIWPQRPGIERQVLRGLSSGDLEWVSSGHQSARWPVFKDGQFSVRDALKAPFLLRYDEYHFLLELYRQKAEKQNVIMPVVFFKEAQEYLERNEAFTDRRIQTDSDTAHAWGVNTPKEYVVEALRRGYTSIVIDTYHIRNVNLITGETPFKDWRESIRVLLPYVRELHIGIGRILRANDEKQVDEELRDILSGGSDDTELIQMLRFIKELGWKGLIVLELGPYMDKKQLSDIYKRVRGTLSDIFEE